MSKELATDLTDTELAQYATDCVLCGKQSDTHIEHLRHMEEIHDA